MFIFKRLVKTFVRLWNNIGYLHLFFDTRMKVILLAPKVNTG